MKLCGLYALDSGEQSVCTMVVEIMTLLPSAAVTTGMSSWISSLAAAGAVEVSIKGIGRLQNPVLARKAR